jgi:deoxyribodipyrimidine photo-lyase
MAASFYSYILKQWWKTGADHFYKHLVDADVAINYYQWQMQSGLVGVHANRIYDPTKQVRDNDPNGAYIKRYVPELRDVPADKIAQPWQLTEGEQTKHDVVIGDDYPEPVVDYGTEARQARAYFKRKAPEAYEAFKDDEVWRRASLSDRHSREHIVGKAGGMQPALTEFTEDS